MKLIIVRHSNREEITCNEKVHLAQLTDEGMNNAISFGGQIRRKLDIKISNIFTSHVERCADTGYLIKKSYSVFNNIKLYNSISNKVFLASYGYCGNPDKIFEWFDYLYKMMEKNNSNYTLIFKELYDKEISNFKTPKMYVKKFFSKYYSKGDNNLVVTHDINIAPISYYLSLKHGFPLEDYMIYPKPLCGLCITNKGKNETVEWVNFEDGEIHLKKLV